jgi:hypothetical protein
MIHLQKHFALLDLQPCVIDCKLNPEVGEKQKEVCYAECMNGNAKKLAAVWEYEERNAETLL